MHDQVGGSLLLGISLPHIIGGINYFNGLRSYAQIWLALVFVRKISPYTGSYVLQVKTFSLLSVCLKLTEHKNNFFTFS